MRGRRAPRGLGLVLAALVLAGCGASTSPGDEVPALSVGLARVDDAIVDGRYDQARNRIERLVGLTTDARDGGDLEEAEADRILAAAAELMSALPAEEPAEEPAEPVPSATATPTPEAPVTPAPEVSQPQPVPPTTEQPRRDRSGSGGGRFPRSGDGDGGGAGESKGSSKGSSKGKAEGPGNSDGNGNGKARGKAKGKSKGKGKG